jgi:multidrug efflux pump
MNFAKFFVDRPIFAAVLSIIIFVVGLIAIPLLALSEYPDVVPPTVQVRAVYPGANPKVIAETVASPLEEAISGVENVMYMKSVTGNEGVLALTIACSPVSVAATAILATRFCISATSFRHPASAVGTTRADRQWCRHVRLIRADPAPRVLSPVAPSNDVADRSYVP